MAMVNVAVGLQMAGAGSSAVGAIYGARSQKMTLGYQADMADLNARVSESAAETALAQGQAAEQQTMLRTARTKSSQRASMSANGVDIRDGSAAEVLTSTDLMGEIDKNTVHANAVRAAWGYRTQATNYQNDALLKRSAAGAINPTAAGVTSLLGSASQVASTWYTAGKAGALGNGTGLSSTKVSGFWGMQ
jgi:hypothetical protein